MEMTTKKAWEQPTFEVLDVKMTMLNPSLGRRFDATFLNGDLVVPVTYKS